MRYLFLFTMLYNALQAFAANDLYVHPDMQKAIELRQNGNDTDDFIIINGKKHFTGFHPSWDMYENAEFRRASELKAGAEIPKEFKLGYSPVRGQLNSDCWAQAGISSLELTVNFADKSIKEFSVQDVIDCSGFGSASSGGQISVDHFLNGAVYNADYPYTGRDARCRKDVTRREKIKRAFFLRGADGGFPTLQEIQATMMVYGAPEICGSASSLGSGGRQDTIRTGRTDHCYAIKEWFDGKSKGWLDATYLGIKNSWGGCDGSTFSNGRCWGDMGMGYYPLAKGDGVHLKGSVITEIKFVEYKDFTPPEPVTFTLAQGDVSLTVTVQPDARYNPDDAKVALQKALNSLR